MKLSDLTVEEFELAIEWIVRDELAASLEQGDVFRMSDEVTRAERPRALGGSAAPAGSAPTGAELRDDSSPYEAVARAGKLSMPAMEAVVRRAVQWTLGELVYEDDLQLKPEFVRELQEHLADTGERVSGAEIRREFGRRR